MKEKYIFGVIIIKKHLFLTGPSGGGKTTMIRNILGESLSMAGGFVTERVTDPDGRVTGYIMLPAASAGGVEGFEGLRIMDYTVEPPKTDNEVFRHEGVRLLEEAQYYPFSLIDEFGGFELVIPQFRKALGEFLSSGQPIIGVLKDSGNAEELRCHLGLGEKYQLYVARLREALEADPDTLIISTPGRGDSKAEKAVREWADEYAHA